MVNNTNNGKEKRNENLSLSVSGKGGKYVVNARPDVHKTYKVSYVQSKSDRLSAARKVGKVGNGPEKENISEVKASVSAAHRYEVSRNSGRTGGTESGSGYESRYVSQSTETRPQETSAASEAAQRMKMAAFLESQNSDNIRRNTVIAEDREETVTADDYTDHITEGKSGEDKKAESKPFESKFLSEKRSEIPAEREKAISPEMARRMKIAAFMAQKNSESIRQNRAAAFSDTPQAAAPQEAPMELFERAEKTKPQETAVNAHNSEQPIPEHQRAITPEMAERLKRAAYLEQKNSEAIRLNRATVIEENPQPDNPQETAETPTEVLDETTMRETESKVPKSNDETSDNAPTSDTDIRRYKAQRAYAGYISKHKSDSTGKTDGLDRLSQDFQTAASLSRGEIGKVVGEAVVNSEFGSEGLKTLDNVSAVSNSVKKSSSPESTVMDLSATLAAVEAKKMIKKLAETDLKKSERAKDRAAHNGNRYGIGKYDEVTKKESSYKTSEQIKAEKYADEPKGKIRAGNSHKMREEKKEYAKKQKSKQIRQKRKELYLRDNPAALKELVNGSVSGRELLKGALKKKATSLIVGGGVGAIVTPILLIIVVFILISAFFSWLSPFSYTLAGEDGTEHSAGTKAEVIDGYTLMIKNYMDVAQAEFYLTYGDWYGGTYNYPAPELDFSTFYSEYRTKIVQNIRDSFQPYIDSATDPNIRQAIIISMNNAISNALANAYTSALAEYNALMASLDDTMTAEENRQHYEVSVVSGANGAADSAEFTGKPVVGTNFFGNVEINSDLTAEELLAYVALYKSLKLMDTSDPAEGEEISLNITPQDINEFFRDTEFFSITAEITEDHTCSGANCKRRLIGGSEGSYSWEYYCDNDHKNITGEIGACKTADELLEKIMELTNAEDIGVNEESCKSVVDSYIDMFKEELNVTADDFRGFGAADNTTAQEFYEALIDGTLENADMWDIDTPLPDDE